MNKTIIRCINKMLMQMRDEKSHKWSDNSNYVHIYTYAYC